MPVIFHLLLKYLGYLFRQIYTGGAGGGGMGTKEQK
jgi:hypothetical protein